ncbi:hypothetical protein CDD82_5205 [Ophiocordyceps australis]|uniref:Uncharacterized protein n=1 Tax=Ophiocordyceps australis TaxID=1399860 RepID=A0A2C5ZKZ2_9HYPO|nr:hypothetical protein CDD82_5205 [Ophiocordyceps australis]
MPLLRQLPLGPLALRRHLHASASIYAKSTPHRDTTAKAEPTDSTWTPTEQNTNSIVTPTLDPAAASVSGLGSKGRTGGGPPLDSTAPGAPPPPKIYNSQVAGLDSERKLTPEQRREVEEHNREFAKNHDVGHDVPAIKVDKKFWKSGSQV